MKLFEIGKTYVITMIVIEDGELVEEVANWTVASVDGTLIKLTSPHAEDMIVNTASLHFVSASQSINPKTKRGDGGETPPVTSTVGGVSITAAVLISCCRRRNAPSRR